jgi:chromosome segregation ATPase
MNGQNNWMQPEDVRIPVTIKEAEAALDMIDRTVDRLEGIIAEKELKDGCEWTGMRRLMASWENKRATVAYAAERLDAGDDALSIELAQLRAKVEALTTENTALKQSERNAKQHVSDVKGSRRERVAENAELKRQNADLVAKNERLSAALRETHVARQQPAPDDVKKALKKSHHDALAFTAEVLDELLASGVRLSPIARLCLDECNDSLPRGYRAAWRAKDYPHKRGAADACADRLAS